MITPTTALVVGAIALIVFGPKQLPELAKGLGRALGEFKKGLNNLNDDSAHASQAPQPEPPAQSTGPAETPKNG